MSDSRWYFTEEQLANSPSRKCGINAEQELSYRQRAANLIQEMGQRLQVSQLCINTAIVYMHRFYAFHSFTLFHRNIIAAAAFFLAAKVEEQPRKLEHVIKILNICLEKNENTRESYAEQSQDLVFNENVLLQTLGFDVAIDHPHTHVVRACQLFNIVTVSRELRQTCYFMASNSLHLTTMCLKYRPTVVAAFCIYIACKWSRWEIPDSSEGKAWYSYVDENVTTDTLKKLTDEYLQILERSPSKFKSKMKAITSNGQTALNTNPSVHGRDEPPTPPTHHKAPHDKQHHHHHHHNKNSTSSGSSSRKQPVDVSMGAPTTTSKQPQQSTTQASSSSYKNQSLAQSGLPASGSQQLPRPRPSSSSNNSQQQPYSGSDGLTSSKSVNEDRTQHRQAQQQEAASFNNSMIPRPIDSQKQRTSSGQASAIMSSSQQQPNQQPPHTKPTNHDQRHSLSSKPQVDYHQKSVKHPQSATSAEFQNRNSTSSSHSQSQQQAQPPQMSKKPSWPQQQQSSHQSNLQKPAQSHVQSSHSQPNLSSSSGNNSRNSSQSLPSYNESTQNSASQPTAQNDYWFNEKLLETPSKAISPLRQTKSMFSPSPEHDAFDRSKLIMTANVKRNDSPKGEKQDRRSSTPNKREKRADQSVTPTSKNSSQIDRKLVIPKLEKSSVPPLISDAGSQIKKRPYSTLDEGIGGGDFNRDSKARKLDSIKIEPPVLAGAMKQPIETNPDIVKSLLQECYTTSKFDSFGMDSPLDIINTDPASTSKVDMQEPMLPKLESRDNGFDESINKRNKSKKKKEKHKHKKRKSHKSDREERDERNETPLKIILSKDSKSSPESMQQVGGLKIKIPIKDVNKTDLTGGPPPLHPAPLKLKIFKEKTGNFNNSSQALSDGGSSSSSSHKKKDKDRSKSKSSKHGNNNNNSEFKDVGYQHQQLSVNKMNSQVPMQNQSAQVQNAYDMSMLYGNNSFSQPGFFQQQMPTQMMNPQQQQFQQQQQQQQQQFQQQNQQFHNYNDFYQNPNMNYSNVNNINNSSSSSGNKK